MWGGGPAKSTYCDLSSFGPALFEICWPDIYLGGPYGPVKDKMYWPGGLKSAPGQRASAYVEGCFVNDILEYCNTNVKLFADDTKLFNNNTNRTECQDLQYDLNALSTWSKTWHMNFNASKCAVLRVKPKTSFTYSLNNTPLKEENEQKDQRIIVSNYLKSRKRARSVYN